MGGWCSSRRRERRVVYIEDSKKAFYPMEWPPTYAALVREVAQQFDHRPTKFKVEDATGKTVFINSEASYRALTPKCRVLEPDGDRLYYVGINVPTSLK